MVIIELTYKKSLDDVEKDLVAHREFLTKYYDMGIFIASGPKIPRDGGVILAKSTKEEAQELIKSDPFHVNNVADYQITQFEPNRFGDKVKEAFE